MNTDRGAMQMEWKAQRQTAVFYSDAGFSHAKVLVMRFEE